MNKIEKVLVFELGYSEKLVEEIRLQILPSLEAMKLVIQFIINRKMLSGFNPP